MTDINDKERELHLDNEKFKNSEHVSQADKRRVEKMLRARKQRITGFQAHIELLQHIQAGT